ncbi:hypothetical protein ACUXZZ_45060 (plasmid) [Streptomyces graminifolii]|uniref:hypothetical protein n=1 Tax=Streptomyces graminifolii TaxID=1266771 RepID=UPI004059B8DA
MARTRKNPAQIELITESIDLLVGLGKPDHAEAIRELLPEATRSRAREDINPTLPVYLRTSTWRAAQQDGAVPKVVEEGFTALLEGRFKPTRPLRGGEKKSNYSARAPRELQEQVSAYVAQNAKKLGWEPSPAQVAAAWLEHKYGAESGT